MSKIKIEHLFETENEQLGKLNEIVQKAIEEEKLISEKLLQFEDRNPSLVSRLADLIASFGGSWKFIIAFGLCMVVWIAANVYILSKPFDAFPFILLNLLLSTIAALQAPIINDEPKSERRKRQATCS